MNWSFRSILYWIMLIGSLAGGIVLIGYSLIEWSVQEIPMTGEAAGKNRELLYSGAALIILCLVYAKDRESYPLPALPAFRPWQVVCVRFFLSAALGLIYVIVWQLSKPLFQETNIAWLKHWGHWSLMLSLSFIILALCIWLSEKYFWKITI